MNSFAVEVEDLVKTFGDFVAVDHIRFQVGKERFLDFWDPMEPGNLQRFECCAAY